MGTYAKKTMTGYKAVENGENDLDAEYYLMTRKEYEELMMRLRREQSTARNAESDAENYKESVYKDANRQLREYRERLKENQEKRIKEADYRVSVCHERIRCLENDLRDAVNATEAERGLNQNLLRIMRERANAKRGIIPKKQHDGFLVLESRQWTERYRTEVWADGIDPEKYAEPEDRELAEKNGLVRSEIQTAEVWKSTLQTPYDAGLPLAQLIHLLNNDIESVLRDLGCICALEPESMGIYEAVKLKKDGDGLECVMYRWKGRSNYRTGLWELDIWTTQPLVVPANRRPDCDFKRRSCRKKEGLNKDFDQTVSSVENDFFSFF